MATAGQSFLGAFQTVRQMNQDRFDNQYRQRVLDLDERSLEEKKRQFDLARAYEDKVFEQQERAAKESKRQFDANLKINQQTADTNRMIAETGQDQLAFDISKEDRKNTILAATNQAETDLRTGNLNDDASGFSDKFFGTKSDGTFVNRNRIIDYLNTNTAALIAETQDGLKDMEIVGFDLDRATGNRSVLLRRKDNSSPGLAPATANGTDDDDDVVIQMTPEDIRAAVDSAYRKGTLQNVDTDKLDLSAYAASILRGKQRAAQEERAVEQAVTERVMSIGNAGLLRGVSKRLIETENDPEGRKLLLEELNIDPAAFAPQGDTRDPSEEFLGTDDLITDPLEGRFALTQADMATYGIRPGMNPFISGDKGRFQTKNKNLLTNLRNNFTEEDGLLSTTRSTGADRDRRLGEIAQERDELLKAIPEEIAARRSVRAAYSEKLENMPMSPDARTKALEEYDAYITQLENYLPQEQKEVVNLGTAVADVVARYTTNGKVDEEALSAAISAGELGITEDTISNMQSYLIDKEIRSMEDLRSKEDIVAQFAAVGIIAATSNNTAEVTRAGKELANLQSTGQNIDLKDTLEDQRERQKVAEEARRFDITEKRLGQEAALAGQENIQGQIQERIVPLQNDLANSFDYDGKFRKEPNETNAAYAVRIGRLKLAGPKLIDVVRTNFQTGAGKRSFDILSEPTESAAVRDAAQNVFMNAGRSSIAALLAAKDTDAGYEEDFLDKLNPFGTDYDPSERAIVQGNISMQDVIVEMKQGAPFRFALAKPDGGNYRGRVTAAQLKGLMGDDPYDAFIAELRNRRARFVGGEAPQQEE